MKKTVINALQEADLVLMVITVSGWKKEDEEALEEIRKLSKKAFLIINKIDLLPRRELLLSLIDESRHRYNFDEIYPCSALKEKSWERLREKIFDFLPEGPVLFPEEETTGNLPREYLLAEVLREKVLAETYQEVPQSVAVEIEEVSPGRNNPGVLLVQASIIVDREQLRPIIIGRGGSKLKSIGKKAREEMEQMLGQPVYLQTRVKVIPRWRDRPDIFRRFGYGEG